MAFIAAEDDLEHLFTANQCSERKAGLPNGRNCVERSSKSTDTPADAKPTAGESPWYQGRVTWPVGKRRNLRDPPRMVTALTHRFWLERQDRTAPEREHDR